MQYKIDNSETHAILDTRYRTKTNKTKNVTQKTYKATDPSKKWDNYLKTLTQRLFLKHSR